MTKTVRIIVICIFSLLLIFSSAVASYLIVQKVVKKNDRKVKIAGHQKFSFEKIDTNNNKVLIPYNTPFIIDKNDETTTYYKVVYRIYLPNTTERSDLEVDLKIDTKENAILKNSVFFSKRRLGATEPLTNKSVIKNGKDFVTKRELYDKKPNKDEFVYNYILYIQLKDKITGEKQVEYSNFDVILNFKLVNTK